MVVVNGPIRHEIGMNWGTGALGPYNHANATIGRAYGLLSQNLQGGSVPGETYLGSQGNNYAYNSITFAENEERSPWEPFHVQHGFKPDGQHRQRLHRLPLDRRSRSACARSYWREHVRNLLRGIDPHTPPTFAARPDHGAAVHRSRRLRHQGEADPVAPRERDDAGRRVLGLPAHPELRLPARAQRRGAVCARSCKAANDELIPMFRLEDIHVVVVGGETNGYWRIMGCRYEKTVSVDDWR